MEIATDAGHGSFSSVPSGNFPSVQNAAVFSGARPSRPQQPRLHRSRRNLHDRVHSKPLRPRRPRSTLKTYKTPGYFRQSLRDKRSAIAAPSKFQLGSTFGQREARDNVRPILAPRVCRELERTGNFFERQQAILNARARHGSRRRREFHCEVRSCEGRVK